MTEENDYAQELLDEIHEKLKKQKEEAQKILEDMSKDKSLLAKFLQ